MSSIEVTRNQSEPSFGLLRRFSKRVSQAGILRRAKAGQEKTRPLSDFKRRKTALKRLTRRAEWERLKKLGQVPTTSDRRR